MEKRPLVSAAFHGKVLRSSYDHFQDKKASQIGYFRYIPTKNNFANFKFSGFPIINSLQSLRFGIIL